MPYPYIIKFDSDPLQALERRYVESDKTLTADQITFLRANMSPGNWRELQDAQAAHALASGVVSINQGRTEAQIAAEYRARTLELLEQMVNLITEARREHNMTITFGITPFDAFGRCSISALEITKKLC